MSLYHILLERDKPGSPWCPAFGDHDRAAVLYERQDRRDSGTKAGNLKIVVSNSANRACVNYVVAAQNQGVQS